ncbi:MAG: M13 family metallopeptidase [Luteimonas sp.]|nr:M13 family metallopeptidase [Luteimonas sp.]
MPFPKTLALALATSLVLGLLPTDADAQRRRPAPQPAGPTACTDFYAFTNKDWLAANTVVGSGTVSALGALPSNAIGQQRQLLDDAMNAPQNEVQKLLGDFWASGLDEAAVESDGATPIAPLLARIDGIRRARDIAPAIAALHQVGIPVVFNFTADLDLANLDRYVGYFAQGGLGLPDPAYYTSQEANARTLLGRYTEYVQNILRLTGTPENRVAADMALVIDLETRIARASRPLETLRDPRDNYALVPVAGLAKQYRNLQLDQYLNAQGVSGENVSLANPELFAQVNTLVASLKPEQWKAYLRFQIGNAMAPYLSKPFRDANFDFHGRVLRGESTPLPRDVQMLNAINRAAGPMLAREYGARYLPAATATRAGEIASHVRDALAQAIDGNAWMAAATKAEAKAKLAGLKIEIGAPRRDLDFSVQPMGRASFGSNMLIASTWHRREEMRRIGSGNADRRWDVLPQQPALAYDIAQNRLIVSAAALQPPVLDIADSVAAQYGTFGALVAHELGRSVDYVGRLVDASGTVRTWWTADDEAAWLAQADRLVAQFNAYAYPGLEGVNVDGALTRNQNAADLAAVELAWRALHIAQPELPKTDAQAFFTGWAQLWRQQQSVDVATRDQAVSVHAPGKWRTNGPLANHPAFADAFQCKAGTGMIRKPDEQTTIWR